MAGEIHITKDFPPAREKAVLLELLNIMRALKEENIDAIVCGGWRGLVNSPADQPDEGKERQGEGYALDQGAPCIGGFLAQRAR